MIIKTTYQIRDELKKKQLQATGEWDFGRKKWVSIESLLKEINKHIECKDYHKIAGRKLTCLDIVKGKLIREDLIGDLELKKEIYS